MVLNLRCPIVRSFELLMHNARIRVELDSYGKEKRMEERKDGHVGTLVAELNRAEQSAD